MLLFFLSQSSFGVHTIHGLSFCHESTPRMSTKLCNNMQSQTRDPMINTFSSNKLKLFLFDFYLNLHQTWGFISFCSRQVWKTITFGWFFMFYFYSVLFCNNCKGFLVWLAQIAPLILLIQGLRNYSNESSFLLFWGNNSLKKMHFRKLCFLKLCFLKFN